MRIEVENIVFILDSNDTEFGNIHAQMIQDFQDSEKLNYFKSLLIENPSTAFEIYNKLS